MSAFSCNAGTIRARKTPNTDTFLSVLIKKLVPNNRSSHRRFSIKKCVRVSWVSGSCVPGSLVLIIRVPGPQGLGYHSPGYQGSTSQGSRTHRVLCLRVLRLGYQVLIIDCAQQNTFIKTLLKRESKTGVFL